MTPLFSFRYGDSQIFLKDETSNPSESHYHRIYERLFKLYENQGKIIRGETKLLEISTGSAGASFAYFCREYGNQGTVIVPRGLPKSRVKSIKDYGCRVIVSKYGNYLKGARRHLLEILKGDRMVPKEERCFFLNHSENWESVSALEIVGQEALTQSGTCFDFFVGVVGNGCNILGLSRSLRRECPGIKIAACDPEEAAVGLYYLQGVPCDQSQLEFHSHDVFGAGAWGVPFSFLKADEFKEIVSEEIMISKAERSSVIDDPFMPSWISDYGISTRMAVAACKKIVEREQRPLKILCLGHDKITRY